MPPGKPFPKGKSGNPGGRSKAQREFTELAREASVTALKKVQVLMLRGRSEAIQLRAAEVLIERAWGKPMQPITGGDGGPLDIRFRGAARAVLEAALVADVPIKSEEGDDS